MLPVEEFDVTEVEVTVVHDQFLESRVIRIVGGTIPLEEGDVLSPASVARVRQIIERHGMSAMALYNNMVYKSRAESLFAMIPISATADVVDNYIDGEDEG